jgi:hypothetical protein
VELSGAIAEIAHQTLKTDFRSIKPEEAQASSEYALLEKSNLNRKMCRVDFWTLIRIEASRSRPLLADRDCRPFLECRSCAASFRGFHVASSDTIYPT